MLLTLKPPGQNGVKGSHEYSIIRQSIPSPRSSPLMISDRPSTTAPTAVRPPPDGAMESSRRELPPPPSMNLPPPPDVNLPAMTGLNQLPPPPAQWQNADDATRHWLHAKAEEDRRKQEEERTRQERERTRQETLRLEQRKIEQSMLRDSLHAGVPPHMVPLIFAGIGGASPPPDGREAVQQQQHMVTQPGVRTPALPMPPPQSFVQQMELSSPLAQPPAASAQRRSQPVATEIRRESRTIPPNPYAALPDQQSPLALPQSHKRPGGASPTQLSGRASDGRSPSLARLTTTELPLHTSHPSAPPPPPQVSNAAKQDTAAAAQPSPSISFHHWVPPGQSQPNTPSGRSQQGSPLSSQTHSHLRSEYQSSPGRKRKAQGAHQAAPSPSSQPSDTSAGASRSTSRQSQQGSSQHRQGRRRSDLSGQHESEQHSRGSSPSGGPPHGTETTQAAAAPSSGSTGGGGHSSAGGDEASARQNTPVNYIPYSHSFHERSSASRSENAGGGRKSAAA